MEDDIKVLAVVPARGGSKSIKYKNIVPLDGYPLIYYVLRSLLQTSEVNKVVVSTEDSIIKNTVRHFFGDIVEIIDRPKELATDVATSEVVLEHIIEEICEKEEPLFQSVKEDYDYILFAQCTSPLTESSDFSNLIKSVIGKDSAAFYIEDYDFFFDIDEDRKKIREPRIPRQLKTPRKHEAGNAWIFEPFGFLSSGSRLFGDIGLCKLDPPKHLEIDELEDLELLECLLRLRRRKNGFCV